MTRGIIRLGLVLLTATPAMAQSGGSCTGCYDGPDCCSHMIPSAGTIIFQACWGADGALYDSGSDECKKPGAMPFYKTGGSGAASNYCDAKCAGSLIASSPITGVSPTDGMSLTSTYACGLPDHYHVRIDSPDGKPIMQLNGPINHLDMCVPIGTKITTGETSK